MVNRTIKIGVIGHIDFGIIENYLSVHYCCHRLLAGLKKKYSNLTALSAMSDGADSIFAQSAISLGIHLESIIPFKTFPSHFQEGLSNERFRSLRSQSKFVTRTNFSKRSNLAYRKSMEWIVFTSNIVLAIWDGREKGTIGGTWEAVSLCRKIRKSMVHIDSNNRTVNLFCIEGDKYSLKKNLSINRIIRNL
jgi:hypothetical protein